MPHRLAPDRIVRHGFAGATIVLGLAAVWSGEPRVWIAAGAFGIVWTAWDILTAHVLHPLWDLILDILGGGGGLSRSPPNLRPTLDDTIRYLESHVERETSPEVDIQSALRLEEIYRLVKKTPEKGRAVLERVAARYPGERRIAERMREYLDGHGDE